MQQPENHSESFIVRVWLERREIAGALPVWRGVVEHVASGKRQYFIDIDAIVIFMAEYICRWGVKPKSWVLLRQQLARFSLDKWLKRKPKTL
jgi:hypothetical protein